MIKISKPEQFLAGGAITIFVLVLFSLSYIAWSEPRDFVGYATGGACTANTYSPSTTQGCVSRSG